MSVRGIEYVLDRIVAILQDSLPAELDLIDAERADGISLEDVPNGAYYKYANQVPLVENSRAILVTPQATQPLSLDSGINQAGQSRYMALHRADVEVHLKDVNLEEPQTTQSRLLRYALAIERVLMMKNYTLGNTVTACYREGDAAYTPVKQSGDDQAGQFTASARLPFTVRLSENL